MKTYKRISIEWEDITFFKGEYEESEIENLVSQRIETTGYLVAEDENYVVIALSIELTSPYRVLDLIKIPKEKILKRGNKGK